MPHRRQLSHCCCFTVRTGSIILACLGIARGVISICVGTIMFCLYSRDSGGNMEDMKHKMVNYEDILGWCNKNMSTVFILCIAFGFVALVKDVLLLFGVVYRKHQLLKPWIVFVIAYIGLMALAAGHALFYSITVEVTSASLTLLVSLPSLALSIFFWSCVFSHYKAGFPDVRKVSFI
jgi:hypothetical protein